MIDARFKTFATLIRGEIKASEGRIRRDMATKDELKRLEDKMATKQDINKLEQKVDMVLQQHEKRLEVLEGISGSVN